MKTEVLDNVVGDLLRLTPLVRRNIQRKLVRTAFARVEENITLPHLEIMMELKKRGTRHIAGIGEVLQIPKPQMTHLVNRLEDLKIVARQADTTDRRVVNISLTVKGRHMIEEMDGLVRNSIRNKLSCLTEEELGELSVCLRKLADILSKL